jgi:hypothetical protein
MTQALGRSKDEAAVLFAQVRKELYDGQIHAYIFFYVVTGRKPSGRNAGEG